MRISITTKLILFVLILSLISTYIVGKYSYEKAKSALVQRTFDQLTSLRIEKSNRIQNFFKQCLNDVTHISQLDDTKEIIKMLSSSNDSENNKDLIRVYQRFLKRFIESSNSYAKLTIAARENTLHVDIQKDIQNEGFYSVKPVGLAISELRRKMGIHKQVMIQDMDGSQKKQEPAIFIVARIENTIELESAMVILEVPIGVINDIMFENRLHNGLGQTGEAYLVGSDYLLRSTSRFENNDVLITKVATEGVKEAFKGITGTKQILDYRNIPVLSSYSTIDIPGLNWVILAEIDVKEAMVSIMSIRSNIMYLTFIIFLLLLGVVALLTSMITAPIRSLIGKTEKVAAGEFGHTLNYKANDEVGDLVNAFNKMTLQLKVQSEKLDTERFLRLNSLIDGQELERRRLSKELHDGLGQLILTNKLKVERALKEEPEKAKQIISESEELFKKTMQEIRNISNGLMPAVLTAFGLEKAIRNLSKEIAESTGLKILVDINIGKRNINSKFETHLYRIVQEALNNVIKHAKATEVNIELNIYNNHLMLSIIDNGIGVTSKSMNESKGNGLNNMKYRAELLGGTLEILGETGKETKVVLLVKNFSYGGD
ncbi:MAG: HAMP domain-containing protein [Bacteroidetes bacterium]|nr:HAMP domain-containing protein [Bacteroidota bacterium]